MQKYFQQTISEVEIGQDITLNEKEVWGSPEKRKKMDTGSRYDWEESIGILDFDTYEEYKKSILRGGFAAGGMMYKKLNKSKPAKKITRKDGVSADEWSNFSCVSCPSVVSSEFERKCSHEVSTYKQYIIHCVMIMPLYFY